VLFRSSDFSGEEQRFVWDGRQLESDFSVVLRRQSQE
jgi:hypothetical protein